jgi:carbamoyl-phosphate synthase small subunit
MKKKIFSKQDGKAILVLEDGSFFSGYGFGAIGKVTGEVVFSTSMVGYPESLTDPSYKGQILNLTYPLIGNYGVPSYHDNLFGVPKNFESEGIKVTGLVIQELCRNPYHWGSKRTLDQWMKSEKIPGLYGVSTRSLTIKLREKGVMLGVLEVFQDGEEPNLEKLIEEAKSISDPNKRDLVKEVTVKKPIFYDVRGNKRVVLIDCGVKGGILRSLFKQKSDVIRVPYNFSADEIVELKPNAILLSNGPGEPKKCKKTIECVKGLIERKIPIMGICLGSQILALALGGDTYKMKYGHRSQNQPAFDLKTGRCYITTQNHGYAIKEKSLKETGLKIQFINGNDKTVEGVRYKDGITFAVQWHPEASPGPYDTDFLFEEFFKKIK